jgi:hypothetical protein
VRCDNVSGIKASAPSRHLVIKALMIAPDDSQARIHFFDAAQLSEASVFSFLFSIKASTNSSGSVIVVPAKRVPPQGCT